MLLLIDNYDSFTYNLFQYLSELGEEVWVVRNDQVGLAEIEARSPERIVISPGPGEMTIRWGDLASMSSRLTWSLRTTHTSSPSSLRYWKRL